MIAAAAMELRRFVPFAVFAALAASVPAYALSAADVEAVTPRATRHLRVLTRLLTSNRLRGRDNDTEESRATRRILIRLLKRYAAGLDGTAEGDASFQQEFVVMGNRGTNFLALIRGRELPEEYVFIGAHYDHLGTRSAADGHCFTLNSAGGRTCNGATDNATGVAAVMAIAEAVHHLPEPPRRSIVLALWDAEEDGLVGSRYYVNHPIVPLAQTVAYINFDILGADLLPSLKSSTFAIGAETGGSGFLDLVASAAAPESLDLHRLSYLFGQERSDYKSFVGKGVPTVFFSDATGACYHTTGDDLAIVNFAKLRAQARIALRVLLDLAERADRLPFEGRGKSPAVFRDAVELRSVFEAAQADLSLFGEDDRRMVNEIRERATSVVSDGPDAFDDNDVFTLLGDTIQTISALTRLECRKY